jgi:hypothetical protein
MGRFGNNKRKIIHNGIIYDSIVEASKSTGVPTTTISSALYRRSKDWQYVQQAVFPEEFFINHPFLNIEVSNIGRVRRSNGVITFGTKRKDGYLYFHHFQTKRNYAVHRLVAETLIENETSKPVVHHIDESKDNNRWDNLAWVSQKENVRHSIK